MCLKLRKSNKSLDTALLISDGWRPAIGGPAMDQGTNGIPISYYCTNME